MARRLLSVKVNHCQIDFAMAINREQPPIKFSDLDPDSPRFGRFLSLVSHPAVGDANGKYRPWRKVKYLGGDALAAADLWGAVKLGRLGSRRVLPLRQIDGTPFCFCTIPSMLEKLHRVDHACGGGGAAAFEDDEGLLRDPAIRARVAIRSLMDEAIESSRIEGAVTTRELARDLLRSGRDAVTHHEKMVRNNYAGMQLIKKWLTRDLSVDMLCDLQAVLTQGTLDAEHQSGRLRRSDEPIDIVDVRTGEAIFTPPPAAHLPDRLKQLCTFANARHTGAAFIHPILKACVLHFMIGHEHPFVDGNGRTARAVFYWAALRAGYGVFEFLVISELILKALAKYPQAYVDSEIDDGDLTYFLMYKLGVIDHALDRLAEHLAREQQKIADGMRLLALDPELNLRQRLLLGHAMKHPGTTYTVASHSTSNRITLVTARTDLQGLVRRGLMGTSQAGKTVHYTLLPDAAARLRAHP